MAEGIRVRNGKKGRTYEASVYSPGDRKKIRQSFPTLAAARSWRRDALKGVKDRTLSATQAPTLREAAADFIQGTQSGAVRDKDGKPYKPSTMRGYERALNRRILPELGAMRLNEIERSHLNALIKKLRAEGLGDSTVRNALDPIRAIYRVAVDEDEVVAVNPTRNLKLPKGKGRRDRILTRDEAVQWLDAIRVEDRALWATAFYAGLRRGELRALRVRDVDFDKNEITVSSTWDEKAGEVPPKSEAGIRTVPLMKILRSHLIAHKLRTGNTEGDLLFGRTAADPFVPSSVGNRAKTDWKRAELNPLTLHDARHTFASLLIDVGANPKAIQEFMGHSTIQMTFDVYGHLMPGKRDEVREQLDAYLDAAPVLQLAQ